MDLNSASERFFLECCDANRSVQACWEALGACVAIEPSARVMVYVNRTARCPFHVAVYASCHGLIRDMLARYGQFLRTRVGLEECRRFLCACHINAVASSADKSTRCADFEESPLKIACDVDCADFVDTTLTFAESQGEPIRVSVASELFLRACNRGAINVIKKLLSRSDIDFNARDKNGWTPFYMACQHGSVDIIELFLARTDIDFTLHRHSLYDPLIRLVESGAYPRILQRNSSVRVVENALTMRTCAGETGLYYATTLRGPDDNRVAATFCWKIVCSVPRLADKIMLLAARHPLTNLTAAMVARDEDLRHRLRVQQGRSILQFVVMCNLLAAPNAAGSWSRLPLLVCEILLESEHYALCATSAN